MFVACLTLWLTGSTREHPGRLGPAHRLASQSVSHAWKRVAGLPVDFALWWCARWNGTKNWASWWWVVSGGTHARMRVRRCNQLPTAVTGGPTPSFFFLGVSTVHRRLIWLSEPFVFKIRRRSIFSAVHVVKRWGFSNQEMLYILRWQSGDGHCFFFWEWGTRAHVADNEGQMCLAFSLQVMFLKMTPWFIIGPAPTVSGFFLFNSSPDVCISSSAQVLNHTGFDSKKIPLVWIICPTLLRDHF